MSGLRVESMDSLQYFDGVVSTALVYVSRGMPTMKATRKQPNSSAHHTSADQMKAAFAAVVQHQQHLRDAWLDSIVQTTAKAAAVARKRALAAVRSGLKMPEDATLKI